MNYYIDEEEFTLNLLQERLENTDLIPSHEALLADLTKNMFIFKSVGITSVGQLRNQLKSPKTLQSLGDDSGLEVGYLSLLRRVINGFFPKPKKLKEFSWLDEFIVSQLHQAGIKNTRQLFEAMYSDALKLADATNLDIADLNKLLILADLCRIQWVSPIFARTLAESGYVNAQSIAQANPQDIYKNITELNQKENLYKGKVGLRDINRLVEAASYVPN